MLKNTVNKSIKLTPLDVNEEQPSREDRQSEVKQNELNFKRFAEILGRLFSKYVFFV